MRKRSLFIILIILVLLVIAGIVFFLMPGNDPETPVVALATPIAVDNSAWESGNSSDGKIIAVSPETVQTVISTLHRAESYSRILNVQDVWNGGKRERSIAVYANGDNLRLDVNGLSGTLIEHLLIKGQDKWIWYSDRPGVFHTAAGDSDTDSYQSILTYEDALSVPVKDILEADYREYSGQNCIYFRFRNGLLGYESECFVDPSTGLLMAERTYDGDFLFYSMDSSVPDISTPDDSVFLEPSSDSQ